MDNYIHELIEIGIGNVIDLSIDKYIIKDEVYASNMEKAGSILDQIKQCLSIENHDLLDEYMEYVMSANERACILAYLVGAKNTIKFMK